MKKLSEFSQDDVDFSTISICDARFAVWCDTDIEPSDENILMLIGGSDG